MMIRAIVFDIGGVLIRTEDYTGRKALERKYGLQPGDLEELVFNSPAAQASTIGQVGEQAVWQNVAGKVGLSPGDLETFEQHFWAGDQLDQALVKFLKECRQYFITALLTNAWEGARSHLFEKYGIKEEKTVDHILISSELGVAKPDPKIYQILADTIDCKFKQILFVDDFIENIIAAKELGIHTIHYQPKMDLISEITALVNFN